MKSYIKDSIIITVTIILSGLIIGCKTSISDSSKLVGCWSINSIDIDTLDLPNACYGISKGDSFCFDNEGIFTVNTGLKKCINNYKILDSTVFIYVTDMEYKIQIKEIDDDKLILSTKFLPKKMMINWKKEYSTYKESGVKIKLTRR